MWSSRWGATVAPVKNGGGLDKGDNKRDIFKVGDLRTIHMEMYIFPEKAGENICVAGSVSDPYIGN